ncbi:MAG: hypothetical protein K6G92_05475 [Bacteroidaceae bacterium]|nr:hypothetical protein [Bacteroidaceae bacterium]
MGWCLSETLEAEHTLEVLRMAVSQATADELKGLVHHSDRGVQYCCNAYTDELKKYGIRISMTEDYKPTDNSSAVACETAILRASSVCSASSVSDRHQPTILCE